MEELYLTRGFFFCKELIIYSVEDRVEVSRIIVHGNEILSRIVGYCFSSCSIICYLENAFSGVIVGVFF